MTLRSFKASRGHPTKDVKLPKMSPAATIEYLNYWLFRHELLLLCLINGHIWLSSISGFTGLIMCTCQQNLCRKELFSDGFGTIP